MLIIWTLNCFLVCIHDPQVFCLYLRRIWTGIQKILLMRRNSCPQPSVRWLDAKFWAEPGSESCCCRPTSAPSATRLYASVHWEIQKISYHSYNAGWLISLVPKNTFMMQQKVSSSIHVFVTLSGKLLHNGGIGNVLRTSINLSKCNGMQSKKVLVYFLM